jgi:hypothetical protein
MDLTKLLSLLETRSLHFTRADSFEDPYEGTWPPGMIEALRGWLNPPPRRPSIPYDDAHFLIDDAEQQRKQMYVNCWSASEYESAALWKLYLQSHEGVAIKTDHDTLVSELHNSSFVVRTSMVKYLDYTDQVMPTLNGFVPVLRKRLSFAHENELRAIVWSGEGANSPLVSGEPPSIEVPITPSTLIKAIHVSPQAPKWFGKLVEQLATRYTLGVPIVRSGLYDRPVY